MMNPGKWAAGLCLLAIAARADAQTLFTYGTKTVSKQEFLKAYNKNNADTKPSTAQYREYLELYTRFKLKVQAALDMRLDTLPSQKAELNAFRNQVAESYMNDEASLQSLINEAGERIQKDIELAHIFVALPAGATDQQVKAAQQKINAAYASLQKGEDFGRVATTYSEDPQVKVNGPSIGYITCFVLPYQLENLAYNTAPGKFSAPFRSNVGFHLFKNLKERPAIGRMQAAQILLAFPPEATAQQKNERKKLADSLYNALQNGAAFASLVEKFSNDNLSYQNGGIMPEFGVGRYEPGFEAAAFALEKDGDISKPQLSSFGYHIIKRNKRMPVKDIYNKESLKQQVMQSDRMEISKDAFRKKVMQQTGMKRVPINAKQFAILTDSLLSNGKIPPATGFKMSSPLLSFPGKTITVKDWQRYLEALGAGITQTRSASTLYDQFASATALEYYRDHLERYSPEFAYQLKEFKEGNLLFEVMQRKVWDVASADSAGLRKYYQQNKNKYWWESSADALIFTCFQDSILMVMQQKLKSDFANWRRWPELLNGTVLADSGRFELGQLPVVDRTNFTNGLITAAVKNEADNSSTFNYIIRLHNSREPRSFEDARGFVINDYQSFLEEKWIATLKKKYPVKVNETVFKGLPQ